MKKIFALTMILLLVLTVIPLSSALAQDSIRVSLWASGSPTFREAKIELFESKYPHINVEWETTVAFANYFSRLLTLIAGGQAPDVIEMNVENFPDYARRGVFEPLDGLIADSGMDIDDFFAGPLGIFSYDGVQYGLPRSFSTVAVFFNKDLFEEAGVEIPTADTYWTWDEYVENAKKLTRGEGAQRQFGLVPGNVITPWAGAYIPGMGVDWINEEGTEVMFDSPEALAVSQLVVDLFHVHEVAPSFTTLQDAGALNLFQTGRVAMFESGPWNIPTLRESVTFEWDVMHRPVLVEPSTESFANMVGISSSSDKKDLAWEFIQAWTSDPDIQALRAEFMEEIPPVQSVALSSAYLDNTPPNNISVFVDAAEYGRAVQAPQWAEIRFGIGPRYLDAMLLGHMSVEDAMRAINREVNELLQQP